MGRLFGEARREGNPGLVYTAAVDTNPLVHPLVHPLLVPTLVHCSSARQRTPCIPRHNPPHHAIRIQSDPSYDSIKGIYENVMGSVAAAKQGQPGAQARAGQAAASSGGEGAPKKKKKRKKKAAE